VYFDDSGQSPADAELNYVENAKKLAMYGVHLHEAKVHVSHLFMFRLVLTCLVLPFWYLLTRVVPDIFQKSSKTVVCVL